MKYMLKPNRTMNVYVLTVLVAIILPKANKNYFTNIISGFKNMYFIVNQKFKDTIVLSN